MLHLLRVLACAVAARLLLGMRERETETEDEGEEADRERFAEACYSAQLLQPLSFTIKLITSLRQVFVCTVRSKKKNKKKKKKVATDCRVLKRLEDADLCSYSHGKLLILLYLFLLCASFSSKPVVYFLFVAEKTPSQTLICDVCVRARVFFFSCGGFMMGVGFEGLRRVRTVFFSVNWILWWLAYLKCFLSSLWYQRRGEKRMWYCAEGSSSHHP